MKLDCRNCNHHWDSNIYPKDFKYFKNVPLWETCPECNSFAVMSTNEWSEEEALEEAKFPNG